MPFVVGMISEILWGFLRKFLFWDISLTDVIKLENNFFVRIGIFVIGARICF